MFHGNSNINQVKMCLELLSNSDIKILNFAILIQSVLSILDLVGVALVGLLGVIAVSGVSSQSPGTKTLQFLEKRAPQ